MRLLSYYIVHTFKNSIKKIFKTWVAIFLGILILIGVLAGVTAAVISDDDEEKEDVKSSTEISQEQEDEMSQEDVLAMVEMIAGGVVITLVLTNLLTGEKNGSKIFTMADVNFLFPSPRKPQSILMFRVILKMGAILVGSLYLIIQIPNIVKIEGITVGGAVIILVAYTLVLIIGNLISVCTYTLVSTYRALKKYLKPLIYGIVVAFLGVYLYFVIVAGMGKFEAAKYVFASKNTRWIPVWGWIRGFIMYFIEGNILASLIYMLLIVILCGIFIYAIWQIKADFYEDAFSGASELQEKINAYSEGRMIAKKHKKKIKSGEIGKGQGANTFLSKYLYVRKRNARLGFITKTLEVYLAIGILGAFITRVIAESSNIIPLCSLILMIIYFRSFGNPIAEESSRNYLYLVPEKPFKKLYYCLIGGVYSSFFDIIFGYSIAVIIIGTELPVAISWFLLFITFDFMCSCSGLLISMIVPSYIAKAVSSMLQMFLSMICLIIIAILIAICAGDNSNSAEIVAFSALVCLLIGSGLCYLSSKMLHKGAK